MEGFLLPCLQPFELSCHLCIANFAANTTTLCKTNCFCHQTTKKSPALTVVLLVQKNSCIQTHDHTKGHLLIHLHPPFPLFAKRSGYGTKPLQFPSKAFRLMIVILQKLLPVPKASKKLTYPIFSLPKQANNLIKKLPPPKVASI